jgi:glycosyltransferase involved in cell wall biosynthesis
VRCIGASVVSGGPALDLPDNVAPLGWLDEPRIMAQLAMADVVAMPSRWEGFGLVAIEAMRAGRPVVASRIGGLPEVVEEGVTGRLVPPDDPEALLAALLADTPETRRTMAEAGRARFLAHFTARDSARQVATLYRQLLGREAARS